MPAHKIDDSGRTQRRQLLDPADYTVAWIAPLEIEAQAALHLLDKRHHGRFAVGRGDDYVFHGGTMCGYKVVIATLPAGQEYGTGSAAALASQLKMFFPNLWFGLLVGVAAGLPNLSCNPPRDIRLGDVLVGLPTGESAGLVAYDLGKETEDGFQPLRYGHVLATTQTIVRSAIGSIKLRAPNDAEVFLPFYKTLQDREHATGTFADPGQQCDVLYLSRNDGTEKVAQRAKRPNAKRTRVWYGPIGSGDKLVRNAQIRDELRDKYGVIGLEMEAAGTMNRIPVGVIRGVCDYGDKHKHKEWQPYAAAMAAAYAKAVLDTIPSPIDGNQSGTRATGNDTSHSGRRMNGKSEIKDSQPLVLAAQQGQEEVIQMLLDNGSNIESKDENGLSPLALAAKAGYPSAVKVLLDGASIIESKDNNGLSSLALAAQHGHGEVIELLLDSGANIESKDKNGLSPLALAAQHGQKEVVQVLLDRGANIESKDNDGQSPLALAAQFGQEEVLQVLLDRGANIETRDKWRRTPLRQAAYAGKLGVIHTLLDRGADIEAKCSLGDTPLSAAVTRLHVGIVRTLLKKGANSKPLDNRGMHPMSSNNYGLRNSLPDPRAKQIISILRTANLTRWLKVFQ